MKTKASFVSFNSLIFLILCALVAPLVAHAQPGDGDWRSARKMAGAYNAFGFNLLAQMRKSFPGVNVFISPVGAGLALAIAQNGAGGQTKEEIRTALRIGDMDAAEANAANAAMLRCFADLKLLGGILETKVQLEIANSLWIDKGLAIKPAFISASQESFQAQVSEADFSDSATVSRINAWVSEHTHAAIPQILEPPLDPLSRLIVLDAVYFKSDWYFQFDPKLTVDKPFTLANGTKPNRPRMYQSGKFLYYENAQLQAIALPYFYGVQMYVLLPRSSLDKLVDQLTPDNWSQWTGPMPYRRGSLELPRMKLENTYELNDSLAALGVRQAFAPGADLSGISDQPARFSKVVQKTFVEVNEKGTEAGAVTELNMAAGPSEIKKEPPPFEMIVDHPFLVAICDNRTGSLLFLGAIMDPGKSRPY